MTKDKKKLLSGDGLTFILVTALFFTACAGVLTDDRTASDGVRAGLDSCLGELLPSLFPFMFLSAFAAEYGISEQLGRLLSPVTRLLFYLPGEAGVTVLFSLVGGYPVGAVGIASLRKRGVITPSQAARMLCFCVNPGPAFLIATVGEDFFGDRRLGVLLFLSQTAASVVVGATLGFAARIKSRKKRADKPANQGKTGYTFAGIRRRDLASAFVSAAKSACTSAVSLCSLVVLFSAFSPLLMKALGVSRSTLPGVILGCILEVTDGTAAAAAMRLPIRAAALAAGWGGLCVHFQVYAASSYKGKTACPPLRFMCARAVTGGLSALLLRYAGEFFAPAAAVFSNIEHTAARPTALTFTSSAALLLSSVLFTLFIDEGGDRANKPEDHLRIWDPRL